MPERKTIEKAKQDKRQGKSASTQAGEFVKEQIHHVREGRHGVRSTKQAIAIGLSEARRSGVDLPAPKPGRASAKTRAKAEQDVRKGDETPHKKSATRSRATKTALKREGKSGASKSALAAHAKTAAKRRSAADRSAAAKKAARTKGAAGRSAAAKKAARTRAANRHA
ncbi:MULTISPECIES: DUF6496 domain-containing protein [unclassified Pigmentiphaga]|uniref:DUF6496 domain-containing protein n=1 Tax=unclassified Pigmentiphaga TaxID=2626614 RepID=UPI000B4234DF|nr:MULTISPECIES: DUF6496 domain-containing protein [unclassified Pigmentiphaga]OVZ62330.1 ku family containing domain-containing protein [Pigmentiphaga sp. NML030171]